LEMELELLAGYLTGCPDISPEARELFKSFLKGKLDRKVAMEEIVEIVRKSPVLFPALSVIGKNLKREIFSRQVIETYFLGIPALPNSIAREILRELKLPKEVIEALPPWIKPIHNHLVFLLNWPHCPIEILNTCLVRPGKVLEIFREVAEVRTIKIQQDNQRFTLVPSLEPLKCFFQAKKGDLVAIHWGIIVQKLKKVEMEVLKHDLSVLLAHFSP